MCGIIYSSNILYFFFSSLAKSQFYLCKYQRRSFKVLHITHWLPRTLESSGPSTTKVSYSLHPLTLPSTELSTFSRKAGASLVAQMVKNLPAMQETQVWSLDLEDPLEKGMASHSRILAWRIPWTEESDGLYSPWSCKESDTISLFQERQYSNSLLSLPLPQLLALAYEN